MKHVKLIILFIAACFSISADVKAQDSKKQDLTGNWQGIIEMGPTKLVVLIEIAEEGEKFESYMSIPQQGAKGIVGNTLVNNSSIEIDFAAAGIKYSGVLSQGKINGYLVQAGHKAPLDFLPVIEIEPKTEAKKNYTSEEVIIHNHNGEVNLSGTLSIPNGKGPFPAVILVSGSGPQNRDSEIFGHKPFAVQADYYSSRGIAVLRYDDRGVGKSTGDFQSATTKYFASDAATTFNFLKNRPEINSKKIGLLGHSEGGVIAHMVASEQSDVAFVVMLAGPGQNGAELMITQKSLIESKMGIAKEDIEKGKTVFGGAYNIVTAFPNDNDLSDTLENYFDKAFEGQLDDKTKMAIVAQINTPWMLGFLRNQPSTYLAKVNCPVFAINGSLDLQVPPQNLKLVKKEIEKNGNKKVVIKEYAGLNHLFQHAKTGMINEYGTIEESISPDVLKDVSDWIIKQ